MKTMRALLLASAMVALCTPVVQGQAAGRIGPAGTSSGAGAGGAGGGTVQPATGGVRARGAGAGGGGTFGPAGARAGGVVGAVGAPSAASTHTCEVGEQLVNLGIGDFHCQGGNCRVAGIFATWTRDPATGEARTSSGTPSVTSGPPGASPVELDLANRVDIVPSDWEFTVEPRLWEIHANGPAAGKVREGDVLVAVNGVPVTTANATFVLGNMVAGRPVNLTLRRGDTIVPAQIFPTGNCLSFGVSSGSGDLPTSLIRDASGRIVHRSDGSVVVP